MWMEVGWEGDCGAEEREHVKLLPKLVIVDATRWDSGSDCDTRDLDRRAMWLRVHTYT